MPIRTFAFAFATTLCGLAASHASAQELPDAPVETIDLGHGIYALITNRAGNVGVQISEDGVFMIDTQMAPLAPALDAAQKTLSDGRSVDVVLNTHLHGDHVLGNAYFAAQGATIIAHPNVRPALIAPNTSQLSGRTPEPLGEDFLPDINVNEGDFVSFGGLTARFYHTPTAHTDGDLFVYFEEADVIHAGDLLFAGLFPFIDLDNGGTVQGMIDGMQRIVDVAGPETQIISGHGPLATEADVEASIAMLTKGYANVGALVEAGHDLEAVQAAAPLAEFEADWNWAFITTERMVWTFYRDITGQTE